MARDMECIVTLTTAKRVQPYGRNNRTSNSRSGGRGAAAKERTFTRTFFCLANKDQTDVPSALHKLALSRNGLGEKKVTFPCDVSSMVVKDVIFDAFPKLNKCGGFELMLTKEKSRTQLRTVHVGACSTDELKCFGTGRIYIRPVQADIPLVKNDAASGEDGEECLMCGQEVPLREMRKHMASCNKASDYNVNNIVLVEDGDGDSGSDDDGDGDGDDDLAPAFDSSPNGSTGATPAITSATTSDTASAITSAATSDTASAITSTTTPAITSATISAVTSSATSSNVPTTNAYEMHVNNAIQETLKEMAQCYDPAVLLKCFSGKFLRGRKLDLEAEDIENFEVLQGRTFEIFVSRSNLLEDAMSEVLNQSPDFSLPLDVTCNGECARDLGGPRREFLGAILKAIKERLFTEHEDGEGYLLVTDITARHKRYFYGAGLFIGYSILQGGPLPAFLHETVLNNIFHGIGSAEEVQFQEGLNKFGLLKLLRMKPCLSYVFRKTAALPVSYPRLVKMFKTNLSEEGTNQRAREEKTYRLFLNYLKEVQAGRRPTTLGMVLKFVTGCENEPILGFSIQPHIDFSDALPSCLPLSNTCANRLTLPCGEVVGNKSQDDIYSFFDIAFANDYFGKV